MSVSLVIPAGMLEMCFDISINTNEISSDSIKQFLLVLGGLTNVLFQPYGLAGLNAIDNFMCSLREIPFLCSIAAPSLTDPVHGGVTRT